MNRHRTSIVVPIVAVLAVAALCACSPASTGGEATTKGSYANGGRFTIAVPSDPGNLDPSMTPSSVARGILGLSYDTLVYQKDDGSFVSGLAQTWSSTATSASFTLRSGVTCSDGSPLTATDVAGNISYIADPANASPLLNVVVHQGATVTADDAARTVTVTSPDQNGFLLNELSSMFVICGSGLKDHAALAQKTLGTGPWVLSDVVANDHYDFSKHQGYAWGPDGTSLTGQGVPDSVRVSVVPNVSTTANQLLNGDVNYGSVTGPDVARLQALKLTTITSVDTSGEIWFNEAAGRPGADPAVREALTLGVDRNALGKIATGNNAQDPTTYVALTPSACPGTDPLKGVLPSTDVDKANSVLDAAGWKVGSDGIRSKDGKRLSIAFRYDAQGSDARQAGTEYLAQQWKTLGVDVQIQALPEAQLNDLFFNTGAWDAGFASFGFNLPSQMVAFVSGTTPPNGSNFAGISNSDYQSAVEAATPQVGTQGCADWAKAEESLAAGYNPVLLYTSPSRTFVRKAEVTAPGGGIWGASLRLRTA